MTTTPDPHRERLEIEEIRANIEKTRVDINRTLQLMKWQPYIVGGAYLTALVAVLAAFVRAA